MSPGRGENSDDQAVITCQMHIGGCRRLVARRWFSMTPQCRVYNVGSTNRRRCRVQSSSHLTAAAMFGNTVRFTDRRHRSCAITEAVLKLMLSVPGAPVSGTPRRLRSVPGRSRMSALLLAAVVAVFPLSQTIARDLHVDPHTSYAVILYFYYVSNFTFWKRLDKMVS